MKRQLEKFTSLLTLGFIVEIERIKALGIIGASIIINDEHK